MVMTAGSQPANAGSIPAIRTILRIDSRRIDNLSISTIFLMQEMLDYPIQLYL